MPLNRQAFPYLPSQRLSKAKCSVAEVASTFLFMHTEIFWGAQKETVKHCQPVLKSTYANTNTATVLKTPAVLATPLEKSSLYGRLSRNDTILNLNPLALNPENPKPQAQRQHVGPALDSTGAVLISALLHKALGFNA